MSEPYRLIFWGPGDVGGTALREASTRPEFEIAGALVYSEDKHGVDVGALVGADPIGVAATTDKHTIYALEADCVIHARRPPVTPAELDAMHDEIVLLLESGKNVISVVDYFYPPMLGPDVAKRLRAACEAGGATLHGSGINPGFMLERAALTLTGLMTDVRKMRLVEIVDLAPVLAHSPMFAVGTGFGLDPAVMTENLPQAQVPDRMYRQMIGFLADRLFGADPADVRIEGTFGCTPAPERFELPEITIEEGKALTITHTHKAYLGEHHFLTNEAHWYLTPANCPFGGVSGGSHYIVEIEGDPVNVTQRIDIQSVRPELPTTTAITAVPPLQAVPQVCAAPPGFMYHDARPHFATDLRSLGTPISR